MYIILGADKKEYGPAPAEVVRRWIGERRLDARSKLRRENEPDWRVLSEFPEFAADLPKGKSAAPPLPSSPATTSSPTSPVLGGRRRTSGVAVAALIVGIVTPCTAGLAGIAGVILGVVALKQIRRSQGRLSGRGLAITGLVLSAVFLMLLPMVIPLVMVAKKRAQFMGPNLTVECLTHLQQLAEGVRRHANDNNDRFPAAASWCDVVQPAISGLNTFQCPFRSDLRCGYALNAAVAGKTKFEIPGDTVLLFECDAGWNAAGDASAVIASPRHGGFITIILVDGTVRQVTPGTASNLRWKP